jgi:hypothetical protein
VANVDKALYQAPVGLDDTEEPELEIEIENPDMVTLEDGSVEITIEPEDDEDAEGSFDENLAEVLEDNVLSSLSSDLLAHFDTDVNSRKEWVDTYVKGLELIGLKYEERSEPWEGACGVFHPLLNEAAIKFQSEAIMETFPASGPVKTQIVGKVTRDKEEAAARVREEMNYQLTEAMVEYRPEHERMLYTLGISGSAFKKVYYDPSLGRQTAIFIPAEDVVVPYGASNIESAERVTHVMRKTKNDLRKLQVAGFYRDVELGEPQKTLDDIEKRKAEEQGYSATEDDRFRILEMHVNLDLEGYEDKDEDGEPTGIALPYVITIDKGTGTVLALRRNYLEDDSKKLKRQHFVHYTYIPGFGFYGLGLIHIVGGYARAGTSILRQLVDAGTLSNLPGGLKSRGLRVKGDDTPIAPGEFRDVDVPSGSIRDNILPLPYKEPSQVLNLLLGQIIEDGRRLASIADLKVSDMSAQAPVGTTMAILERMLKVMSAVQARIHFSLKQEFKLLKGIVRDYADDTYTYEVSGKDGRAAKKEDFEHVEIIPVSDPNAATMGQRIVQYQAVLQLAQTAPQIYDLPALHRQMLEVIGVKNANKLVPMEEDQKPKDPVSENMFLLKGKPAKAFMYQDHEAHLAVHNSLVQDPQIQQMMQQNPAAQQIMAAIQAHMMEHIAFKYRKDIEKQLGVSLPPMQEERAEDEDQENMSPEMEVQVSQLSAMAAQQLLQSHIAQAQAEQAAQQAQDPVIQMQQQELQLKAQDSQRKMMESQAKMQLDARKLALEDKKVNIEAVKAGRQADQTDKKMIFDALKGEGKAEKQSQPPEPKND